MAATHLIACLDLRGDTRYPAQLVSNDATCLVHLELCHSKGTRCTVQFKKRCSYAILRISKAVAREHDLVQQQALQAQLARHQQTSYSQRQPTAYPQWRAPAQAPLGEIIPERFRSNGQPMTKSVTRISVLPGNCLLTASGWSLFYDCQSV